MRRQFFNSAQTDWDEFNPLCSMAYNSLVPSSSGYSLNFLISGREFRLPMELILPTPEDDDQDDVNVYVNQFVIQLGKTLEAAYGLACTNLQQTVKVPKLYYDRKSRHADFKVDQS